MRVQDIDRATLIGASMGGAITLRFALQYPNQIAKMVLANSVGLGGGVFGFFPSHVFIGRRGIALRPSRKGTTQLLKLIFHNHDLITDRMIEAFYEMSSLPGSKRSQLRTLRSTSTIMRLSDTYRPILDRLVEIECRH